MCKTNLNRDLKGVRTFNKMSETTTDENEGSAQGSDQGTQGEDDLLVEQLLEACSNKKKHKLRYILE